MNKQALNYAITRNNSGDDWSTPDHIINKLIELDYIDGCYFDPCPLNHNIKDWDGLEVEWGSTNFVNPPYSSKLKNSFVEKAISESKKGKKVVLLIPAATSTRLFHDWIYPNAKEILFVERRIKFGGKEKAGMHDSMIVILGSRNSVKLGTFKQ